MSRRYINNDTITSHSDLCPTSKGVDDRALLIAGVGSALVPFCPRMSCFGEVTELLNVESLNACGMLKHAKNKKVAQLAETYGAAAVQQYLEEQLQKKWIKKFNLPDSSKVCFTSAPKVSSITNPKICPQVSRKASLKSSPNSGCLDNQGSSPIPIYSSQPRLKSTIKAEKSSTSLSPNKTDRFSLSQKVELCLNKWTAFRNSRTKSTV